MKIKEKDLFITNPAIACYYGNRRFNIQPPLLQAAFDKLTSLLRLSRGEKVDEMYSFPHGELKSDMGKGFHSYLPTDIFQFNELTVYGEISQQDLDELFPSSGLNIDCLAYLENATDSFQSLSLPKEDLIAIVKDGVMDYFDYVGATFDADYEEGVGECPCEDEELDTSEILSQMVSFFTGLKDFHDGKELDTGSVLCDFFEDIRDIFGVEVSDRFLYENLGTILQGFLYPTEDGISTVIAESQSLYNYFSYKDRVPCDERDEMDRCIRLILNPYGLGAKVENMSSSFLIDHSAKKVQLLLQSYDTALCQNSSSLFLTGLEFNPFLGDAFEYVKEHLPILEARYGTLGKEVVNG